MMNFKLLDALPYADEVAQQQIPTVFVVTGILVVAVLIRIGIKLHLRRNRPR